MLYSAQLAQLNGTHISLKMSCWYGSGVVVEGGLVSAGVVVKGGLVSAGVSLEQLADLVLWG